PLFRSGGYHLAATRGSDVHEPGHSHRAVPRGSRRADRQGPRGEPEAAAVAGTLHERNRRRAGGGGRVPHWAGAFGGLSPRGPDCPGERRGGLGPGGLLPAPVAGGGGGGGGGWGGAGPARGRA